MDPEASSVNQAVVETREASSASLESPRVTTSETCSSSSSSCPCGSSCRMQAHVGIARELTASRASEADEDEDGGVKTAGPAATSLDVAAAPAPVVQDSQQPQSPELTSLIEPVLDLEALDKDLFRGTHLWKPPGGRGVFGGQVVGQALVAATRTVEPDKDVNSMHCYFLLPGDASVPIIYQVTRVRDGRSFSTRVVVAIQNGQVIFESMVSFHVQEKDTRSHQKAMPFAPEPESLMDEPTRLNRLLSDPRLPDAYRPMMEKLASEKRPIDVRYVRNVNILDGVQPCEPRQLVWMRAKGRIAGSSSNLHRCVVAYASDFALLATSMLPWGHPNPNLKMLASLDHALWFHAPFRADEWMLYALESPRFHNGRGFSYGHLYKRDGTLAVSVVQEGLARFHDTRPTPPPRAKM